MSNKPTHYLSIITGTDEKSVFTRVAPLWATEKGGLAGNIPPGLTITGRIVVQAAKADDANA